MMILGGFSSLEGRVIIPTCSPGPGTSFMMFIKVLKISKFLNRKFRPRIFQNMSKFQLKPRYVVIIGNPIEIDSKPENYKYCFEKSDLQKTHREKLIIYF